jgi:hypothetical protein
MPTLKQIVLVSVFVGALLSTAVAQDTQRSSLTVTASATGDRVRITAPSSIVQLHVEVYAPSGEKVFDQEIRGGNVFDWHLQDGQAQRLAPGTYVCVVTTKSVSGKLTQKTGTVTVEEKSVSVQLAEALSAPQAQAIGPVEQDSSWMIPGKDEPQTTTVIANDGQDGQMIRGRGALTFRIGNFFSGIDQEQMRLTEAGNLGLGTAEPQAKLDVAGTIRAERFLIARPKLGGGDKTASNTLAADSGEIQPLVAGTGTQNQIAKWTDNAGTLGDSVITETPAGKVGVGITVPLSKFHVSSSFDALRLTSTNDTTPVWAQFNTSLGSGLGYFGVEGNTPGTFLGGTLPYATALSSGGSGTALQLGSAGSVRMTILSGGNVGIGTVTPTARLQVVGDLLFENKWRTETTAYTPNLIGGFLGTGSGGATPGNRVRPGVVGATIGGGGFNGSITFPSGGVEPFDNSNSVFDWFGTVAGGFHNRAGSDDATLDNAIFATVGGGYYNIADGYASTVGGGVANIASGHTATVGGGSNNTATGYNATVPGGSLNTAAGASSFAAGYLARANHDGAFVWADSTLADFVSTGNNQFLIRATGGVGIGTNTPSNALSVNGGANFSGGVAIGGILTLGAFGTSGSFPLCRDLFGTISGCPSSLRYKKDVALFAGGLDIINRLRPIAFTWKQGEIRDVGLAAEDVAKVEPLLTFRNDKGEVEGVRYNQLSAVFVNAFKEQQAQIQQQSELIGKQQTRLAQQQAQLIEQQQQFRALKRVVCPSHRKAAVCK